MSESNEGRGILRTTGSRIVALLLLVALALFALGLALGVFTLSDLLFPQPTPAMPAATSSPAPTRSPRRTLSPPAPTPAPTRAQATAPPRKEAGGLAPIVCVDPDLDELGGLPLAPGQRFQCTFGEQYLTDLLQTLPDLPCSDVRVYLNDGMVELTCKMFLTVRIEGVVDAQDCRPVVRVTGGTAGIAETVQEMIDEQMAAYTVETICFEQVIVDDGQATVVGHGR
jgi:hypothetical protein